jgi:hypothetical protein
MTAIFSSTAPISRSAAVAEMSTLVTLLTADDCKLCDQASAVLKRVSTDFEFELRVVDIATDEGKTLASTVGLVRVPGVLINEAPFSGGRLSERRLRRELTRLAAIAATPSSSGTVDGADPEVPEAELSRAERRAERQRLRVVRKERRRQAMARGKQKKSNKKDAKKEKKGKRR